MFSKLLNKKRAQGIPMETVIIAIIVLVVLVVIIAFFVSGTGTVIDKIKGIFGASKGEDLAIVKSSCETFCDQAVSADLQPQQSKYCTYQFKLDKNNDNKADTTENNDGKQVTKAFYCDDAGVSVGCSFTCPTRNTGSDVYGISAY